MADQPAPRPVGPLLTAGDRPSYDELQGQADGVDHFPLAQHLDHETRSALDLPPTPSPVSVDRELSDRIRTYFLDHPDRIAGLPDEIRDLITL
ncbi:hypothetical protein [Streptomyces sp. NBC_01601]|uniref:hypothetical protein n=1 Tax=Streptomyces sp. NBC_01601 TaxID=2975892 RepID=UPI002E2C79ED|nr:hypothetical protein [Streptomyces sp. NBC_01601]